MDTSSEGTEPTDIEPLDIELEPTQPAFVHRFSLNKYPLFSHATTDMPYNISHHGLLIEKTCNMKLMAHLQYSVSTKTLLNDGLYSFIFYTRESLMYLLGFSAPNAT